MSPMVLCTSAQCLHSTHIICAPLSSGLEAQSSRRMVVLEPPLAIETWFCCDLSPEE